MNWRWNYNMAAGIDGLGWGITVTSRTGGSASTTRAFGNRGARRFSAGGCAMEHLHQYRIELKYPDDIT